MTSGSQHLIVMRHLHMLDIRTQRRPELAHQGERLRIGIFQRRQDHLVPSKQRAVRRRHATEFGAGDGVARHEPWWHVAEHFTRTAHDIALGAADVSDHCVAQFELRQFTKQPLQRKDRRRKLNYVSPMTSLGERVGAAIHHAQFDRQLTRACIQIEADHLATKASLTQALGERAANQAKADHNQAIHNRRRLLRVTSVIH